MHDIDSLPHYHLYTDRLLLKLTTIRDAKFLLELLNTPKWLRFIGDRKVYTEQEAENYIKQRMYPQIEEFGYGSYTVINLKDNIKVGTCGLYNRPGLEGMDIGFAFLPQYEGMGYAYEASTKLIAMSKTSFGLDRLVAITTKDNFASQRLLQKLNFGPNGTTVLPDDDVELIKYERFL